MSDESTKATQRPIRGCQTFRSRGLLAHAATFAGAIALWLVAYLGVVSVVGWTDLVAANGATATEARLFAGSAAGVVMGSALGFAYTRALGSPMLNVLLPSLFTSVMPDRVYTLLAAPPDTLLVTDVVTSAAALAAPSGVALLGVVAWYRVRFGSMAGGVHWEDRHFPRGFRLAAAANEEGSIDWEEADYGWLTSDASVSSGGVYKHAAVVTVVWLALFGAIFGTRAALGSTPVVTALRESPTLLLAVVGLGYVAWLNRRWRAETEI